MKDTIKFKEFTANGTTYSEFEMREPTFSELMAHNEALNMFNGIEDGSLNLSPEVINALSDLAKLCATNLTKKSDFNAFPSGVALKMSMWVSQHIFLED